MELRWNPIREEWIIVSGKRGKRPLHPEGFCPFCPGSEEIPDCDWTVLSLPNRFPALHPEAPEPEIKCNGLYHRRSAKGVCEVIVYTPNHNTTFAELSIDNIKKVIDLWIERYDKLGNRDYIDYVYIFENKGRIIGVTIDHPHGQLYAFPFIPPIIQKELDSSQKHWKRAGDCLFCTILKKEKEAAVRVVCENEGFVCFLPFHAHWPYGVHIYPKKHVGALIEMEEKEIWLLARILKKVLMKFDNVLNMSFPYMMVLHQIPTDGKEYPYYHFHIEFYSPYREKDKIKYFASVEAGAGTITFDYTPELKAKELRETPPI
jgi:UDPglucose--hexose-1-phosphate uridylyltransferase